MDPESVLRKIRQCAAETSRPDGTIYPSLSTARSTELAARLSVGPRQIDIIALENGIVPERYVRNMTSLTPGDQVALLNAHVAVVGLGGLGGTVTEILARLGVGRLSLIDGDRFEDSNLNRQLLSTISGLGQPKATAGARRVADINPSVEVLPYSVFFDTVHADRMLDGVSVAVDCLDTLPARFVLEAEARARQIPLVSAALAGTTGQVTVVSPDGPGLEAIYGPAHSAPEKGVETRIGTLPHTVSTVAALECAQAVKLLLGDDDTLSGRLLIIDLDEPSLDVIDLS